MPEGKGVPGGRLLSDSGWPPFYIESAFRGSFVSCGKSGLLQPVPL